MNATTTTDCPFCDAPAHLLDREEGTALACDSCGVRVELAADPDPRRRDVAA
jgi:transcription elongation factor Elf1